MKPISAVKTDENPRSLLGHHYNRWCELYRGYYLARQKALAEDRKFSPSFKTDTDYLIFTSGIKKIFNHGFVAVGLTDEGYPRFGSRQTPEYNNWQEAPGPRHYDEDNAPRESVSTSWIKDMG